MFLTYDQSSFVFERFLTTNLSAEPYWEGSALILCLEESSDELQDTLDNANRNTLDNANRKKKGRRPRIRSGSEFSGINL